jgi:hypothetical protein
MGAVSIPKTYLELALKTKSIIPHVDMLLEVNMKVKAFHKM